MATSADEPSTDPTLGRLFADASRDLSALIRGEIQLAKSELKVSVKAGGKGIALFGAAAFIGMVAFVLLSVAFAYFLTMTGLHVAWAFLIVFGVYLALAGLLGLMGKNAIAKAGPPERTIEQARETKEILHRGSN